MTREEKLAYAKGYNAGKRGIWPAHLPPFPPALVISRLMQAMRTMRNMADGFCASIDPEDNWNKPLGSIIDEADQAMQDVSEWIEKGGAA